MDASLSSFLEVRIYHAIRHHWIERPEPFFSVPSQYTLWLVEAGEFTVTVEEQRWTLRPGSVMLATLEPRTVAVPQEARWLSIAFRASLFNKVDALQAVKGPLLLWEESRAPELLHTLLQEMVGRWMGEHATVSLTPSSMRREWKSLQTEAAHFSAATSLICQGLGRTAFGLCWERLEESGPRRPLQSSLPVWLERALALIDATPGISVAHLAHEVGFSRAQLRRGFLEWLGASPQQYLIRQRMEHSRRLLATTDWTIQEVAHSIGFRSAPTFTRLFKETYGTPPAQYRASLRTD